MPDGEFDWGGRLRKGIGGAQRFPQDGRKNHSKSAKAEGSLTATPTGGAGTKVGLSDPVEFKWECHRSTDKSYPGDNRLITPKSSHRRSGLALDVGSSHPGAVVGPKGWAVRPLKRYASWVQNVVRQFGPYPAWA